MEKELKGVYPKLQIIQEKVLGLGKDKQGFGFKYVTGSKVLDHIKPIMNELHIILKQEILSIENVRQDYQTKNGAKSEILSKVMMRFTWIDTETGEKDENLFGANGQNDWDKGVGSALTYAERYFLLKYFHINTDEDDIDNPERKPENEAAQPTEDNRPWLVDKGFKYLQDQGSYAEINEALENRKMKAAQAVALKELLKLKTA